MSKQGKKKTSLNVRQKLKILDILKEHGKTRKELCVEYQCNLSTIARIVRDENKYRKIAMENSNTNQKRVRKGHHDKVDEAIWLWFKEKRAQNACISGPVILEQAKKLAQLLGIYDFEPSNGWLHRWKKKQYNLSQPTRRKKRCR